MKPGPDRAQPLDGVRGAATTASQIIQLPRPLIVGHRGYAQFAPENTLPSFQLALQAGVDLVELDCRQSRDGHWLVIHDAELDRTTDARRRWEKRRIRVATRTAHEICGLDAGSWFHPQFATARVPRLEEAIEVICEQSIPLLERKSGDAASLARFLRDRNLVNRVIVQSFDWKFLRLLHQQLPEQVLGALGPPGLLASARKPTRGVFRHLTRSWILQAERSGARIVVWSKWISARVVRLAHQRGLKVWVYTINRPELARRLLRRGVDGIITDNPAMIWKTLALEKPAETNS